MKCAPPFLKGEIMQSITDKNIEKYLCGKPAIHIRRILMRWLKYLEKSKIRNSIFVDEIIQQAFEIDRFRDYFEDCNCELINEIYRDEEYHHIEASQRRRWNIRFRIASAVYCNCGIN